MLDRRRFLAKTAAAALTLGGGGLAVDRVARGTARPALAPERAGLPARQHAWNAVLAADEHGNPVAPRFHQLLLFDVERRPDAADVRRLEGALRTLEHRYAWGSAGLLFTVAWGPRYFERTLGVASPVERPRPLSDFELPTLDDFGVCVHLASNGESRVAAAALTLSRLGGCLHLHESRPGFVGARLPAAHQRVSGVPGGDPVKKDAPLYMGFKSGYVRNQASEDAITLADGPFAGGTTMHVSRMRLRLDDWYGLLDERTRVQRMFAPEVTPKDVERFTTDAPSDPARLAQAARRYGMVGHAQASAVARRNGRPRILRRDFDSDDGGEAGLNFVALQRSIEDFVTTRKAMNAARAPFLNPAITDTVNNGINEFIFVTRRANYVIPRRKDRAYPLLPGREAALA
jgi:dye decolorizing peroxidase